MCLCWLLNIICVKVALLVKNRFLLKTPSNFSHNLRMSHQNLKKNSGINIDHMRNKIRKNEGFLKISLFEAALFLQKMALKILAQLSKT